MICPPGRITRRGICIERPGPSTVPEINTCGGSWASNSGIADPTSTVVPAGRRPRSANVAAAVSAVEADRLGDRSKLLGNPGARLDASPSDRLQPESPQRLTQLARLADLLAQLPRARVRHLGVRRAEAFRGLKRLPEREE